MQDVIGLVFIILIAAGAFVGLRHISRQRVSTSDEFERNASEKTGIGASMNALQELIDPAAAKGREVAEQMRDGRYLKKKREGKSGGQME